MRGSVTFLPLAEGGNGKSGSRAYFFCPRVGVKRSGTRIDCTITPAEPITPGGEGIFLKLLFFPRSLQENNGPFITK